MNRWKKHCEQSIGRRPGALYSAIRKYGAENFYVKTLLIADDWNYLCEIERRAIVSFKTFSPDGYNLTPGGEGVVGSRDSRVRALISIAQKRRYENSPEDRERLRLAGIKGRANRVYTRRAESTLSKSALKPPLPKKSKKEISDAIRAAMAKPETVIKVQNAAQQRAANPEWRKRISISKTGKKIGPCSEQRKAKIAEARRREWQDPIIRNKRLAALKIARDARHAKLSKEEQ